MVTVSQSFWNYAKNINKVASLEDAFVSWANNNLKDIESVKNAWDAINNDLRTIFAMGEPTAPITDPAQAHESSDNTLMSMLKDDDNQTANPVTTPQIGRAHV